MSVLRAVWHFIKWLWQRWRAFVAWVNDVLARIFGAPLEAVQRVIRALIQLVVRVVEALLEGWERIWGRNPQQRVWQKPQHLQACAALATLAVAVLAYGTPIPELIHADRSSVRFIPFVIVFWIVVFAICARWSTTDIERWWVRWLARIRERTGLVRLERLGALVALFLLVSPTLARVAGTADSLPLRLMIFGTFVVFLADTYHARAASRASFGPPAQAVTSPPGADDDGREHRRYEWHLDAGTVQHDCVLDLAIDHGRYQQLRDANPQTKFEQGRPHFEEWVVGGVTPEIDVIASEFARWCADLRWSRYIEVCLALSFAQHFPYRLDLESKGVEDYWRYPIETLVDGEGDCEDMSILAAAILRRMGHTVALFFTTDHAALAVSAPPGVLTGHYAEIDGRRFYYCETTSEGWKAGDLPPGVSTDQLRLSLVEPEEPALAA